MALVNGSDLATGAFAVKPLSRRRLDVDIKPFGWLFVVRTGDLERVRARFSRLESDPDPAPSFSSDIGGGDLCLCCFAADRVVGAK